MTPEPQYAPTGCPSPSAISRVGPSRRVDAQVSEPGPQLGSRPEQAVRRNVCGRRRTERTGNVAGYPVDGLGLAPVPGRCPRVQQDPGPGHLGRTGRVQHLQVAGAGREVAGRSRLIVGADRLTGGPPGLEPAVQHSHPPVPGQAVPEVPQQPPRPRRDGRIRLVVHDDIAIGQDPGSAHGGLELGGVRQRVAAGRSGRAGELAVQVDVHGGWHVTGPVRLDTGRPAEAPAHVDQGRRHRSGQRVGELSDTDQRTVRGGCHVSESPGLYLWITSSNLCTTGRRPVRFPRSAVDKRSFAADLTVTLRE